MSGTVYIKAVTDHKYDGLQLRDFTVSLVRRRRRSDNDVGLDVLRETALQLPVIQWSSRVVSVLDSGAEGPGFKSQPRRCRVTTLGKLFTPIVPLFTKQRSW